MNTFTTGLVTVSFRPLTPRQIVDLAVEAKVQALEWGGDVHVPPGDVARAKEAAKMSADAGLKIVAYGSYLRLGEEDPANFARVIDSALALAGPSIRVWAGRKSSRDADADYRKRVADDALRLADLAAPHGIVVCYEYHVGTLTDTDASALQLLEATQHPFIKTLWQPPHDLDIAGRCKSLRGVLSRLQHVHVFHWLNPSTRTALGEGADGWLQYLRILRDADKPCPLLLEFVKNDDPKQLIRDADALRQWIGSL